MSFIQNLFTSRDNNANSASYVGQQDRIWWDPVTNSFYYSDGSTPGGIAIGGGSGNGVPGGPVGSVQLNAGGGNFAGSSNLVFSNNILSVVGNISATGNIQGNVFLGNGSQLTGVITSLPNTFGTVNSNGTSLVADSSSGTLNITSGNNLVITSNAGTDTMTIAVADAPVFSGNVTIGNIIANAIVNNGSGNIYHTGNLLPTNINYTLGTVADPWGNAFFGPQSITILDATGNIGNSVVIENIAANIVIGTTGFTINEFGTSNPIFRIEALTGQLFSNAQTIIANAINSSNTTSGSLQTAGGVGIAKDLYVGGNIHAPAIFNGNSSIEIASEITLNVNNTSNSFVVTESGAILTSTAPISPTLSALEINGNVFGAHLSPNNTGVMIHATGLPNNPTRVYLDAIGANTVTDENSYPAFVGRAARGTIDSPQPLTGGDIMARFGGNPYSAGGFNAKTNTRIDFVAIEDQTATERGTQIEFWNTPAGSNVISRTALFDSNEIRLTGTSLSVVDGNDNDLIQLRQDGNLVFSGSGTLSVNNGFFVSSVASGSSDGNLVVYTGGEFKYGSQLKDYTGNIGATNVTITGILQAPQTTKASNATGTPGQICWDANYIYVCTATNTWKRSPLTGGY